MNKWEFEEKLTDETKSNIFDIWREGTEHFKDEETMYDYINEDLGNSTLEMIKEILDDITK